MSRRSIDSSILEEKFGTLYGNEDWKEQSRREEINTSKVETKSTSNLPATTKEKRDRTPPATKTKTTKGVLQNNTNTQNKENRSATPTPQRSKSPVNNTAKEYTSVNQDRRVKKLKALGKILFYLMRNKYHHKSKEYICFYKWRLAATETELKFVIDQLQTLDDDVNRFVVKETSFRGKVKTLKREVDTKVVALEQYIGLLDKK